MNAKKKSPAWGVWLRPCLLAGLVIVAGVLAVPSQKETPPLPAVSAAPQQTVKSTRQMREEAYARDLEEMQLLAGHEDEGISRQAAQEAEKMIKAHQSELAIEQALSASGFENTTVIVQGNAVTVIIQQEQLTEENSARILALCVAYAEVNAENIRIMDQ